MTTFIAVKVIIQTKDIQLTPSLTEKRSITQLKRITTCDHTTATVTSSNSSSNNKNNKRTTDKETKGLHHKRKTLKTMHDTHTHTPRQ